LGQSELRLNKVLDESREEEVEIAQIHVREVDSDEDEGTDEE
jgi:hypothetical protein